MLWGATVNFDLDFHYWSVRFTLEISHQNETWSGSHVYKQHFQPWHIYLTGNAYLIVKNLQSLEVSVSSWPACSPDLSTDKNVSHIMKTRSWSVFTIWLEIVNIQNWIEPSGQLCSFITVVVVWQFSSCQFLFVVNKQTNALFSENYSCHFSPHFIF